MTMKRMRGRSHRSSGSSGAPRSYNGNIPLNRNHVFDSSGPDLRVRGTAQQLFEKYLQLGRDATGSGDRVMAESYFQHAEHYFRILNAINQATQQSAPQQPHPQQQQHYQNQSGQPQNQNGQYNGQRRPQADDHQDDDHGYNDQPGVEAREIPISAAPEG
jgi:hypothetical protein